MNSSKLWIFNSILKFEYSIPSTSTPGKNLPTESDFEACDYKYKKWDFIYWDTQINVWLETVPKFLYGFPYLEVLKSNLAL